MQSIDVSKCVSYDVFSRRLNEIEIILGSAIEGQNSLVKISKFIENNQDIFINEKTAPIRLDSIGTKVRHFAREDPFIDKLQGYIRQMIPPCSKGTKDFLQYIRSTILNPSDRFKALADWIDFMRVPLSQLDLTEDEFVGLVTRLEFLDLTDFNFKHFDMVKLTDELLKSNLKFKTTDIHPLTTIAKLCIGQNDWRMAVYITNFGIGDEAMRAEIAMLCARDNGWAIALCINNFAITNEGRRIEIAKLCAQQNGSATAENIKNFAIEDEKARIEIAMLCAEHSKEGLAKHIKNFSIEDEEARVKIALLSAQRDVWTTAVDIRNFAIGSQTARIEIAKLCAKQNSRCVALNNFKFAIEDQKALVDIAKICAQQDAWSTACWFEQFGIREERAKAEIATLCAKQDGECTARYINNFKLQQSRLLYPLFLECIQGDQKALSHIANFSPLPRELLKFPHMIRVLQHEASKESNPREVLEQMRGVIQELSISEDSQKIILDMNTRIQALSPHTQNAAGLWLLWSILLIRKIGPSSAEWLLNRGIWSELGLLQDPSLRVSLTSCLRDVSAEDDKRKPWDDFLSHVRGKEGKRALMLLVLPFFSLQKQGVEESKLLEVANYLSTWQKKNNSPLRNVYQVKNVLRTLFSLASSKSLTPAQKKSGFEKIFFDQHGILDELKIIKNVTAAKGLQQLKNLHWPKASEDLSVIFHNSLGEVIPLLEFKGNIAARYDEVFGTCRNPGGLLTYAAGLKTLNEPVLLCCLSQYVVSVMDGTFKNKRYDTINNPHLAKVSEGKPWLVEKWKEEIQMEVQNLPSEEIQQEVFDSVLLEQVRRQPAKIPEKKSNLYAVFTDDPIDLLLCGTDVNGSCQRLDGIPERNKGLLGYLMDGKNRLLAIKEGDKIVARCILRLLWDGKQPVVYRDRFYPERITATQKQALNVLAKKVAQKLELPLTCDEGTVPYYSVLQAMGGPAPYEYSDGAGGLQKDGRYKILAKILN